MNMGELRAWQSTNPTHDLPIQLCRSTLKAQYWLRQVMDRMYTPGPDGYCGDEDNGQTSAWYVFSALGFYPVCPGTDEYVVGAPLFKKATLHLENGNSLIIHATDNNKKNMYIQTMNLNGTEYKKRTIYAMKTY